MTNDELDDLIAEQEDLVADAAESVDIRRGHLSKENGQLVRNRREAIRLLESRKEITTVKLRSGI